jgi:hypothetical protein
MLIEYNPKRSNDVTGTANGAAHAQLFITPKFPSDKTSSAATFNMYSSNLIPHLKMPRQPSITKNRLDNAAACLAPALALLKELNDAFGPPFVQPIANTIETLISMAQVRRLRIEQVSCL